MNKYPIIKGIIEANHGILVHNIKFLGEGWINKAYIVNDEWVFRFSNTESGSQDLEKEIALLPELSEIITVKIPDNKFTGKQDNGFAYSGGSFIGGLEYDDLEFNRLNVSIKSHMAVDVAKFIDEVSSFPIEKALKLGVDLCDMDGDYTNMYIHVRDVVFPLLNKIEKDYITSEFNKYLNNENFKYVPKLMHADLSLDHMRFHNQRLTGVIDFGDLEVGDPDYEYIYLMDDCGIDFTRNVMEARCEQDIDAKLRKVGFFVLADDLGLILEGIDNAKPNFIEIGIDKIKKAACSVPPAL